MELGTKTTKVKIKSCRDAKSSQQSFYFNKLLPYSLEIFSNFFSSTQFQNNFKILKYDTLSRILISIKTITF